MMTLIARWFAQTIASRDYLRSDYVVLWLILSVGVFLRFWGLGNVGLHGDEETMAMPAMAILETGHPYLPSGMYYSRALLNIYLMSGSAWIFGESEWAFRLPSAIVGLEKTGQGVSMRHCSLPVLASTQTTAWPPMPSPKYSLPSW